MSNYNAFDISLRVKAAEKYKLLKNVIVFSNTYRYDSMENRITYSKIFDRDKPGISSTYESGGAAGFDLDALIGDEYGRWSAETMQVVDKTSTVSMAQIFPEVPEGMKTSVPIVYLPGIIEEAEDDEDNDNEVVNEPVVRKRGRPAKEEKAEEEEEADDDAEPKKKTQRKKKGGWILNSN